MAQRFAPGVSKPGRPSTSFVPATGEAGALPLRDDATCDATILAMQQEIAWLRDAVRARDEFISTAAHELRNPMTPMLMTVQLLQEAAEKVPGIPDRMIKALARLDRAVNSYIKRTTALLDVSRLAADTFRLEPAPLDLAELMRSVADDLSVQAERAGSVITVFAPDRLDGIWDELAVRQVLENLASNAIKYGNGQPVEFGLHHAGQQVVITVRDHGIGISHEEQERIFAPFERAVTRREQSGFGLGLWVVGRLVNAMGATIDVSSTPGHGSMFTVCLPNAPPAIGRA